MGWCDCYRYIEKTRYCYGLYTGDKRLLIAGNRRVIADPGGIPLTGSTEERSVLNRTDRARSLRNVALVL
jgi:hypothetical protein